METRQSLGGRATAVILKKEALERYYSNPNKCLNCGIVIEVPDGGRVVDTRAKKFCTRRCSARYNNMKRGHEHTRICVCRECGTEIIAKERSDGKGYIKREVCDSCIPIVRARGMARRLGKLFIDVLGNRTKKDVFDSRKNWQSARSSIRRNAEDVYGERSEYICEVCGYDKYVEVCHITPVSDFPDSSLISEINDRKNLVGLCPNHHWEFDHGILKLPGSE